MRKRKFPLGGSLGSYNITNPLNGQVSTNQIQPNIADPYYNSNNLNNLSAPQPRQNFFQSQTGQGVGQMANVLANVIPQGENSAISTRERDTDASLTGVASAIGPWWGALAKVGTSASAGVRGDDRGSHAQGFIGDQLSPFHQFNSLKDGQSREKVMSFLNPVGASHLAADRRKKTADTKALVEQLAIGKGSESILANYPVYGVGKFGMKLPNGGKLPYPTDDSQVNQLANNVAQYEGDTHEQGGIPIDTNMDSVPEAEIEDQEVVKDDMVLSNRLSPTKEIKNFAKELGIRPKKRETYASLAAKIGKKKGEYETNLSSGNTPAANSARIMTERMDAMMDMLFMDQQVKKFPSVGGNNKFPGGGKLPTVSGPIYAPQDPRTSIEQNRIRAINNLNSAQQFKNMVGGNNLIASSDYAQIQSRYGLSDPTQQVGGGQRNYLSVDPRALQQADSVIQAGRPFLQNTQGLVSRADGGRLPLGKAATYTPALNNPYEDSVYNLPTRQSLWERQVAPTYPETLAINTPSTNALTASIRNPLNTYTPTQAPAIVGNNTASSQAIASRQGDNSPFRKMDWQDYRGDLAALAGTAANQMIINRMETNFNPETADAPLNTYTDRTGYLTSAANQQFTAASRGLNSSSSQDNLALKANLYAKSLQGLNQSLDQEFQRKDANTNRFNELVNRSNIINANIRNQGKLESMNNRNQKRALTQANVDNLLRSYIGNEAVRDFKKSEYTRNYLNSLKSGERGVSERIINNLPKQVKRELGFK